MLSIKTPNSSLWIIEMSYLCVSILLTRPRQDSSTGSSQDGSKMDFLSPLWYYLCFIHIFLFFLWRVKKERERKKGVVWGHGSTWQEGERTSHVSGCGDGGLKMGGGVTWEKRGPGAVTAETRGTEEITAYTFLSILRRPEPDKSGA